MSREFYLRLPAGNIQAAYTRAKMLWRLRFDRTKQSMDAGMVDDGFEIAQSRYYGGDLDCLRCYACSTISGEVFLFVDGIDTTRQGEAVWFYYTGTYPLANNPSGGVWYDIVTTNVIARVLSGINTPTAFFASGYSAGGPVAARVLAQWPSNPPRDMVATITVFGSPKPGIQPVTGLTLYNDFAHWQNTDDPVPLIPPSISFLERQLGGLSIYQGRRLTSFQLWPRGIGITPSSAINPSQTPNTSSLPPTTQIATWLQQQTAGIENAHSISVYRARLELASSRYPASESTIEGSTGGGGEEIPTLAAVRRMSESFSQTIFHDAQRQNTQPVTIPVESQFVAGRVGKIWYVYFRGQPIAMAPYKRRARGLARIGNDLLRRLQNEAVVNPDELTSQFAAYLADASTPGSGFTPLLNTQP